MSDELPPDVARLLAAEREAEGPPDVSRARVQARLEATLGLAVGVAAVASVAGAATGATGATGAATATTAGAAAKAAASAATAATGKVAAVTSKAAAFGWQSLAGHIVATKIVIAVAATGSVVGAGFLVTRAVEQHHARVRASEARVKSHAGVMPRRGMGGAGGGGTDEREAEPQTIGMGAFDPGDPGAATASGSPATAAQSVDGRPLAAPPITAPPIAAPANAPPRVAAPSINPPPVGAPRPEAPRVVAPGAGIVPHHGSLAVERELVATAREALLARDFTAAASALDRHARRFPVGQLAEERDSLRVRVAAARGDRATARALAAAFARAHPGSLFWPAVRAAIAE